MAKSNSSSSILCAFKAVGHYTCCVRLSRHCQTTHLSFYDSFSSRACASRSSACVWLSSACVWLSSVTSLVDTSLASLASSLAVAASSLAAAASALASGGLRT